MRKDAVSEVKHRHSKSVASLKCARTNKSIIYILMRKKKEPVTSYPAAKHPKHSKLAITDMR